MDLSIALWAFVIFILLQPLLRQFVLERLRQRKISQIERARGSRVILLVHREERLTLLGLPIVRYLDMNDSEEVMRAIQLTDPNMPVDLVLHTPGGLYLAATQIALALSGHDGKVTIFVPHYAMSGGTLIALAADEIVMCRHSPLGPLEPQVEGLPAVSLLRVVEQKPIAEIDDETGLPHFSCFLPVGDFVARIEPHASKINMDAWARRQSYGRGARWRSLGNFGRRARDRHLSRMWCAITTATQSIFALFTGPAGSRCGCRTESPDDALALSE